MRQRRGRVLALSLMAVAAMGREAIAAPPLVDVGVIVAGLTRFHQHFSYTGRVVSPHIVNMQARVTGFLRQRDFHQGADVKKGEQLYVIEQGPYRAAYDQANANLAQAKAQLTNANLTLSRDLSLLHTPAGQQSVVDDARATADSDQAAVAAARAQRETAAINLGYTRIMAPISGRIGASTVNVGNVVGPNAGTLTTIVSENPMDITFAIPARDIRTLRRAVAGHQGLRGLQLRLRLADGKIYGATGHVRFVGNQIDANTDSLLVQGDIGNPRLASKPGERGADRVLTSGEFVTVLLRSGAARKAMMVPRAAVLADQFGDYVLTIGAGNKVVRANVKLASTTPALARIASGVAPGTKIIVSGIEKIHPGQKVKPIVEPMKSTRHG